MIPKQHKCSRCKGDMRKKFGCGCIPSSGNIKIGSKSGNAALVTQLEYEGYNYPGKRK